MPTIVHGSWVQPIVAVPTTAREPFAAVLRCLLCCSRPARPATVLASLFVVLVGAMAVWFVGLPSFWFVLPTTVHESLLVLTVVLSVETWGVLSVLPTMLQLW